MTARERAEEIINNKVLWLLGDPPPPLVTWTIEEAIQAAEKAAEEREREEIAKIAEEEATGGQKMLDDPRYKNQSQREFTEGYVQALQILARKIRARSVLPGSAHPFKGRLDRDCEICGLPDRAEIHKGQGVELYGYGFIPPGDRREGE